VVRLSGDTIATRFHSPTATASNIDHSNWKKHWDGTTNNATHQPQSTGTSPLNVGRTIWAKCTRANGGSLAGQAIWDFFSRTGVVEQPETQPCRNNLNLVAHLVGQLQPTRSI
jgi:hypothetical protein